MSMSVKLIEIWMDSRLIYCCYFSKYIFFKYVVLKYIASKHVSQLSYNCYPEPIISLSR